MAEQSFVVKTGFSGSGANLTSIPNSALSNSTITINGTPVSLGGSISNLATTTDVSTAITNLIDSAPGTLDTLNELAAALNDDANFSTTIANSLSSKAPLWLNTTVSSNITLIKNNNYFVDTTAARTLTLPASPSVGDQIEIFDASGTAGTYNITLDRNSNLINGNAGNFIIDVNGGWYTFVFTGNTYGWKVA